MEDRQLQNTKEPKKWDFVYNHRFQDRSGRSMIFTYVWIAAEILLSILFASFFFVITMWLINIDYTVFVPKHENMVLVEDSKKPAIVWYNPDVGVPFNKEIKCFNGSQLLKCDVYLRQSQPDNPEAYLFYAPFLDKFPLPRHPDVLWGLLHNETPLNNLVFMYEKVLNLFNMSATFSRHSDVPFPLMGMRGLDSLTSTRYFVITQKKNIHLSTIAPVIYLQTNTYTSTNRQNYVKDLMEYIQIDSYGGSLQNKFLPINQIYTDPLVHNDVIYKQYLYDTELLQFMGRYKFIIAIENAVCDDYVSEKLWRALEVGVVPIYFGSPLIRDWLPNNKSAILVEDYSSPEQLSKHLHYLLQNDTAYEEYLKHKILGQISNRKLIEEIRARPYQNKLKTIIEKFECFTCEKIHMKNTNQVNMMTKKHYNCPEGESALRHLRNDNENFWKWLIKLTTSHIDNICDEIRSPDRTVRCSNTSFRQIDNSTSKKHQFA